MKTLAGILQSILENVFHIPLALGAIQNRLEDTSRVIQPVCDEIENELTNQPVVNIDETGYPHNKSVAWLWVFVTNSFALFTIRASSPYPSVIFLLREVKLVEMPEFTG